MHHVQKHGPLHEQVRHVNKIDNQSSIAETVEN